MDEYLLVNGGHPLKGELMVSGSKNGGLYTIAAALLTPDPVVIHNIPEIADVSEMAAVCRSLGSHVEIDGNTLQIHTPSILSNSPIIVLILKVLLDIAPVNNNISLLFKKKLKKFLT